jgi:hypothetical protein
MEANTEGESSLGMQHQMTLPSGLTKADTWQLPIKPESNWLIDFSAP